jgi:hypothetical protein
MENRENVKKTWKSHGICHPVEKFKMFKLNTYQVFQKNGLRRIPHIPCRSVYCIFYLNEGLIFLIFKYLRPIIFWKTHGNSLEKSWKFSGKVMEILWKSHGNSLEKSRNIIPGKAV